MSDTQQPYTPLPPQPPPQPVPPQSGLTDNAAGAIAYLTFIPAIIFLAVPPYSTSPFVRFHAWQSIFLSIGAFVVNVGVAIFIGIAATFLPWGLYGLVHLFSMLVYLLWFILWIVCVMKAVNGGKFVIPIIGNLAEQMANK
jgi:uncharacterized membrane protein